ncbi:signal transducer and transcription activator-like [Eupeodes corollae]|uniref:signal transducer and transcription activator-like n=1 Tax=Eupeodes corollae TaxID=290404 RepID=UPI002492D1F3|nr:signal transducer and transcription activator-like [Eupeodes corollae]XP_055901933.1 signal transducer and transcription activator-like [Eupeodes corollae]
MMTSFWSSVTNSVTNGMYEMKSFYDRKGMFEIRVNYANWIEDNIGYKKSDAIEEVAIQFYNGLDEHIRTTSSPEIAVPLLLSRMRQISPLEFYTHLIEGMAMEVLLTSSAGELLPNDEMHHLKNIQELIKSCDGFYQIPNLCLESEINQTINELFDPVSYLANIFEGYDKCQKSVFDELKNWQRQQNRNNCTEDVPQKESIINQNNVQMDKLNQIQNCIELLVEVTFRLLQMIDSIKMRKIQNRDLPDEKLEQLAQEIRMKQKNLMIDSFIVDSQPNQVIKTNTNFSSSVRWLIGPQLGLNNSLSNVKCIVVSEFQARNLNKERQINHSIEPYAKEIRGNDVKMEYQEKNRIYSANFKGLQIKKIQRSERKGSSESVMDEKLALLFQMTVTINNSSFIISTLSQPVVVIVHGNQEHQACATIMWDTAFAEIGRELFVVPDKVSWEKLSDALYLKCFSETKRGFTDANRYFLYEKFFPNCNMVPEVQISWTKFCKDELTGYNFTFWEWFYHTVKLIKERLLEPWNADLIEGFISRKATTERLQSREPGTFLLRFSDSSKGAITISYVNEYNNVDHIQPWTSKDLQNRCLADRIRDLKVLTKLFPHGIDKSYLFDKFCSKDDQKVNVGYVPGIPITTIIQTQPVIEDKTTSIDSLLGNMLQDNTVDIEDMLMEDEPSMEFNYNFGYNYDKSHLVNKNI